MATLTAKGYRPIGERIARTMTAGKLAQMWGAR